MVAAPGSSRPRLLAILGSGETAPTMTSVHADLLARLEPPPTLAVFLDTPFGFQENADEICARAVQYFRENVGHPLVVASYRHAGDRVAYERMLATVRQAGYVFSGPGSPSYALRHWRGTDLPEALREKLRSGGCVVFSSAAACTLGVVALPVYEIYKVGEEVRWLEGIDVLAAIGVRAAVIPHFDNREGGTHDTRYCYMGERRLRILEEMLPDDVYVLGVDEHTACIVDVDAETVTVRGRGAVSLRRRGRLRRIPAGETVDLDVLRSGEIGGEIVGVAVGEGSGVGGGEVVGGSAPSGGSSPAATVVGKPASPGEAPPSGAPAEAAAAELRGDPFLEAVDALVRDFDAALAGHDLEAALAALLDFEQLLWDWSRETFSTDAMDRARSLFRTLLVRLAEVAEQGIRDPAEVVGPFVEAILELRRQARAERRFADADALRDALVSLGVEVRDTPTETTWSLRTARDGT